MSSYLHQLTGKLLEGVALLPPALREKTAAYVRSQQQPDGGFAGREGGSDLYYTGFALRSLAILGECQGPLAERAGEFLQTRMTGRESVVDLYSLVYAAGLLDFFADLDIFAAVTHDWRQPMSDLMACLRRADGGYAKGAEGAASSTYHTFLVLLCLQAIEREIPDPDAIVAFMRSQRTEEGGFREIRVSRRGGTNPTAAAIGVLDMLGQLDDATASLATEFLIDMQTDEGGFRANTRIPIADVLSTFTALVTLETLGGLQHEDLSLPAVQQFVESLADDGGGFLAAAWDDKIDVEYTFYGLGALALLARADPR